MTAVCSEANRDLVVDFVRAFASGERVRPDFEDGVRNQRVLDAIERSAANRAWQAV